MEMTVRMLASDVGLPDDIPVKKKSEISARKPCQKHQFLFEHLSFAWLVFIWDTTWDH